MHVKKVASHMAVLEDHNDDPKSKINGKGIRAFRSAGRLE